MGSLQLLEIKLQTGSFIPRLVQLILHLNFKEAAVSLSGAERKEPGPQLAAFANLIKFPPISTTPTIPPPQLVFMETLLIYHGTAWLLVALKTTNKCRLLDRSTKR